MQIFLLATGMPLYHGGKGGFRSVVGKIVIGACYATHQDSVNFILIWLEKIMVLERWVDTRSRIYRAWIGDYITQYYVRCNYLSISWKPWFCTTFTISEFSQYWCKLLKVDIMAADDLATRGARVVSTEYSSVHVETIIGVIFPLIELECFLSDMVCWNNYS